MKRSKFNPSSYEITRKIGLWRRIVDDFIPHLIFADIHRWVLWVPVLIAVGIGYYFSLKTEPNWYSGLLCLSTMVLMGGLFRKSPLIMFICIFAGLLALGFTAAQYRTMMSANTSLKYEIGPVGVSGRIQHIDPLPHGVRVTLDNVHIDGRIAAHEIPQKVRIRINSQDYGPLHAGDWIEVYTILSPPSPPSSPHAFDFQRYAYFKGIGAVGFSYGSARITKKAAGDQSAVSFNVLQSQLRQSVSERIKQALPGERGTLAVALITGEKKAIKETTVQAMRDAGLAHLLAISGLHIGLVAGLVLFMTRAVLASIPRIAATYPIKTWAAILALVAALAYTVLAGTTIPTLRAFTMMLLVLSAIIIGRRGITLRLVAVAATVILVFQPESLLGPSFQLSFAAVTGLVASYEAISRLKKDRRNQDFLHRTARYVGGIGLSTLIAGLATAPFAAYHFHQLASYGVIANLVAVPITALWIMPSGLIAMVLMPFGLEQIGLTPMGWGIEAVIDIAKIAAAFPSSVHAISAFSSDALIIITGGCLWLCLWQHRIRYLGLSGVVIGIYLALSPVQPILLAHNDGELFAYQDTQSIALLGPGTRKNRFVRNVWTQRAGFVTPLFGADFNKEINCDLMGCVIKKHNKVLALVWNEGALIEDCWIADIILSSVPVRRNCPKPTQIIDRFDLWQEGSHAIYLDEQNLFIESTRDVRGIRPWTIIPRSKHREVPTDEFAS